MQITCRIELSMSSKIGKPTCQGRRLIKWKLYEKSNQREKGKCPKATTKVVITKAGKFWKRRVQFPFGVRKSLKTKVGKF